MMFSLTRSNLLRQRPGLNEIIRRLPNKIKGNESISRNILMETAIVYLKWNGGTIY